MWISSLSYIFFILNHCWSLDHHCYLWLCISINLYFGYSFFMSADFTSVQSSVFLSRISVVGKVVFFQKLFPQLFVQVQFDERLILKASSFQEESCLALATNLWQKETVWNDIACYHEKEYKSNIIVLEFEILL